MLTNIGMYAIDRSTAELAMKIRRGISNSVAYSQVLGNPINLRAYALYFDVPTGPPPEYEQSLYVSCLKYVRTTLTKIV